jgi:hypothetical protein
LLFFEPRREAVAKSFSRLLDEFEEAVREHAFIGTKTEYPDEVADIERDYEWAKVALLRRWEKANAS